MKTSIVRYKGFDLTSERRQIEVRPFEDTLEFLQSMVDGHIEHFIIDKELDARKIDMWINEEGKFRADFTPTFALTYQGEFYDAILGPCVFTRYNNKGETLGLSPDDVSFVIKYLHELPVVGIKSKEGLTFPCLLAREG